GALDIDDDDLAGLELAKKDLLRQGVLDLPLDRAAQRPGAEHGVESMVSKQFLRRLGELETHVLVVQPKIDLGHHQVDDLDDLLRGELVEDDDVVDPVEEIRPETL